MCQSAVAYPRPRCLYSEPSPPRGDDALSDALKRLALRQQCRQYTSSSHSLYSPVRPPSIVNASIPLTMETMAERERTYDARSTMYETVDDSSQEGNSSHEPSPDIMTSMFNMTSSISAHVNSDLINKNTCTSSNYSACSSENQTLEKLSAMTNRDQVQTTHSFPAISEAWTDQPCKQTPTDDTRYVGNLNLSVASCLLHTL